MKILNHYAGKKILIGIVFVVFGLLGFGVFPTSKVSADCLITKTLRVGSVGVEVQCLQLNLGIQADGVFGPMTRAKVIAFQANKGLNPDGIFGPQSIAAWLSSAASPIGSISYSAGCLSNSGFNTQTGLPCSTTVSNLPMGCLPGYLYSSLTGQSCSAVISNLPLGCASINGYSSLTGLRCDSSVNIPTIIEDLSGGAGDMIVTSTSVDVEDTIKEGDTNRKILGFRVEASGSDIALNNIRVSFENSPAGTSSTRLDRYIDEVSVWMGNKKVGSADVSEFTKSGNVYSKNISLSNAIVREGSGHRQNFYIAVSALSNIDGNDLSGESWEVSIKNNDIRFTDGDGAILTGGPSSTIRENPDFINLATSGDVRVRITKASGSPEAGNIEVSDTGTTSNIDMLEFTVKAEGTDITFDSMDFNVAATGTADVKDIISELALYRGSTKLGDLTSFSGDGVYTIELYDDQIIKEGDIETYTVSAKVKKIGTSTFAQGDTLSVSAASPLFSDLIEDTNGDKISNITGSANGGEQTFYSEGINVSDFSSSSVATSTSNGVFSKQTYSISYKVSAFGNTYYMPKTVARDADVNAGLLYTVKTSAGVVTPASSNVIVSAASSISSNASTVNGYYEIPDGETRTFNVTITLGNTGSSMVSGFYRIQLDEVRYDMNQIGTPSSYILTPQQNYVTADRQLDL